MIDVLKGTWIYKLQAGENRKPRAEFKAQDIKEVVYEEIGLKITILITLKDGTQRLDHPHDLNMKELEALTTWAENLKNNPR